MNLASVGMGGGFSSFGNAVSDINQNASQNMNFANDGSMISSPSGGTWRGLFGDWFNAQNIAKEDWLRQEQQNQNAYLRNLALQKDAQAFNSSEAEKAYQRQRELSGDQYGLMVEGMKKAGINPVLALGSMNNTPSAPSASSGSNSAGGGSSYHGRTSSTGDFVRLLAGLVSTAFSAGTALTVNAANIASRERIAYKSIASREAVAHSNLVSRERKWMVERNRKR